MNKARKRARMVLVNSGEELRMAYSKIDNSKIFSA